jgi:hypothetical protein
MTLHRTRATLTVVLALCSLAACDTGDRSAAASDDTVAKADSTPAAQTTTRRYALESGIVELSSDFMGDQQQTVYFDEYGAKEAVHSTISTSAGVTKTVLLMRDATTVVYDPDKKSGTTVSGSDALTILGLGGVPSIASLSDQAKRELKLKPIAPKTILGKRAEGATIDVMGTAVSVWSWHGVPLRMEAEMQGTRFVVEATSLKTNIDIPSDRFEVPPDVTIKEAKSQR